MRMIRVPNSQLNVCTRDPTSVSPNKFRQTLSPANGSVLKDAGKRTFVQQQSYSDGKLDPDVFGCPLMTLPSPPVYRSCVHYEVPSRFISSVVFLDKLLSISLLDPEEQSRTAESKTLLFKSTLSLRLGVSPCYQRARAPKTNGVHGVHRPATKAAQQGQGLGFCCSPVSEQPGSKVAQNMHTNGNKPGDLNARDLEPTSELLSFKEPGPWNTKEYRQQGNADEPTLTSQSNFSHRPHTFSVGPDVPRTASKKTDSRRGQSRPRLFRDLSISEDTCDYPLPRKDDSLDASPKTLSLKEALELFRPDFISRSQGRVRRLEQRARRRRALQGSNPDLVQGLREDQGRQKRNCTMPDPLSDNLFKPRERSISGREMQLRSRRIYNKLPEVMRKREEEKKRTVSQTNRLRAEVFKKRLLDQVLQR